MFKTKYLALVILIFVLPVLFIVSCSNDGGGIDSLTEGLKSLQIEIEGEGKTNPPPGIQEFEEEVFVDLTVDGNDEWEFYAWTGENADDIIKEDDEFQIKVDENKELIAFFARDFFEFEITEEFFLGSEGEAIDLTDNAPYPPGFEIEIKAVPDTEEDEFLHWTVELLEEPENSLGETMLSTTENNLVDPRDFFEDYEASQTTFTMPETGVIVRPYFTTRTPSVEPGDFDFDHNDFDMIKTGEVGITEHYWDVSELPAGTEIDFYFHARNLPDRFDVYYGNWGEEEAMFSSSWVSLIPDQMEDSEMYPEGVSYHNWHKNVTTSNRITFDGKSGGKYAGVFEKKEDKDVLKIVVEGRDDGTKWDYAVNAEVIEEEIITSEQLDELDWDYDDEMVESLNENLRRYGITNTERVRHFISQAMHESQRGIFTVEIGSEEYFEDMYGDREDLGNTEPGDGYRFRGAGYIQLTGRNNYEAFSEYMGDDEIVEQGAEYVAEEYPWRASGYWWDMNNMNQYIDGGATVQEVSSLVNLGHPNGSENVINGLEERRDFYDETEGVIEIQ